MNRDGIVRVHWCKGNHIWADQVNRVAAGTAETVTRIGCAVPFPLAAPLMVVLDAIVLALGFTGSSCTLLQEDNEKGGKEQSVSFIQAPRESALSKLLN